MWSLSVRLSLSLSLGNDIFFLCAQNPGRTWETPMVVVSRRKDRRHTQKDAVPLCLYLSSLLFVVYFVVSATRSLSLNGGLLLHPPPHKKNPCDHLELYRSVKQ